MTFEWVGAMSHGFLVVEQDLYFSLIKRGNEAGDTVVVLVDEYFLAYF